MLSKVKDELEEARICEVERIGRSMTLTFPALGARQGTDALSRQENAQRSVENSKVSRAAFLHQRSQSAHHVCR